MSRFTSISQETHAIVWDLFITMKRVVSDAKQQWIAPESYKFLRCTAFVAPIQMAAGGGVRRHNNTKYCIIFLSSFFLFCVISFSLSLMQCITASQEFDSHIYLRTRPLSLHISSSFAKLKLRKDVFLKMKNYLSILIQIIKRKI